MVSSAIVVVGSEVIGVFMVWLGMDFSRALYTNAGVLVFVGLILYDLNQKKLSKNKSFVLALLIFTIPNLLFFFVPKTAWWQSIANGIVKVIS